MATAKIIVKGMVQGVSFRAFAKRNADGLAIHGYVKNLGDGSVEINAEGTRQLIEQFAEILNEGPPGSRVRNVNVEWLAPTKMFSDFRVIY
jgi:acylphosphatase